MEKLAAKPFKTGGKRSFLPAALLAILCAQFLLSLQPLQDIDLWWHLATGRYLAESASFLDFDPFGLAGSAISPGRESVLNGYWMAQLLFYGVYRLCGEPGLVILRGFLFALPPFLIALWGWRRSFQPATIILITAICAWGILAVDGLRPNHLTIALVSVLFLLLHAIGFTPLSRLSSQPHNLRYAWFFTPLMPLWANLHGGFLLGVAVIVLYLISETAVLKFSGRSGKAILPLWCILGASILLTGLSPNGFSPYSGILTFQGSTLQQRTSEYLPLLQLAREGILIYWPFIVTAILYTFSLRGFRSMPTAYALSGCLLLLGLSAFRYAPLFIAASVFSAGFDLDRLTKEGRWMRVSLRSAAFAATGLFLWFAIGNAPAAVAAARTASVDRTRFPVDAVNFLQREDLAGVVFNHFNWGGYLAWRGPGKLITFIDGRSLSEPLLSAYTRTLWLPREMQMHLDRYGVDLILVPRLNPFSGELYALTDFLWNSDQWVQIYRDPTAMLFIRRGSYPQIEQQHAIDKDTIFEDVLTEAKRYCAQRGKNAHIEKALRLAALRLGSK